MKSNFPLISVCIPTYNRANYLRNCLDSIIEQQGFDLEKIEIVISDNASLDNTHALVEQYQRKYPNIQYFRNSENIGANLNLFRVAECAQGKYIWFMGDDDTINTGGLERMLYFLSHCNDIVLIQTNMFEYTSDALFIQNGVEYWKKLVDTKQANKLSVFLLFLSMVIVRREDFMDQLASYRRDFPHKLKESFSHFYILVRCIYQGPILLVGDMVSGGDGDIFDDSYFKNSSKNWYNLVVRLGIDKIFEDKEYLLSIGISESYLISFRANFMKIYQYMRIGDILRNIGLYRPLLLIFRKFFLKKI